MIEKPVRMTVEIKLPKDERTIRKSTRFVHLELTDKQRRLLELRDGEFITRDGTTFHVMEFHELAKDEEEAV